MQYVFLIRSRAGGKKYVTRLRIVTYFLLLALERIKNTYCMDMRPFLYLYTNFCHVLGLVYARSKRVSAITLNYSTLVYQNITVNHSHAFVYSARKWKKKYLPLVTKHA